MSKSNIKVVKFKDMTLLLPRNGLCQECGVLHNPEQPHNKDSIFYQTKFYMEHDRAPTWVDAMDHCTDVIKAFWIEALSAKGIKFD